MKISVKYNQTVIKGIKKQLSQEIINSAEGSSAMRNQIRQTFQQANRRIQNIEKANLYSPAVAALEKQSVVGYSKFSIKGFGNSGESWEQLKKEYAKAISFLQSPTSTATGARQWETQVKKQLGLSDEKFNEVVEDIKSGYNSFSSNSSSLIKYQSLIQDIYDSAMNSEYQQMEQDAKYGAEEIERQINEQASEIAGNAIDEIVEGLENTWKM